MKRSQWIAQSLFLALAVGGCGGSSDNETTAAGTTGIVTDDGGVDGGNHATTAGGTTTYSTTGVSGRTTSTGATTAYFLSTNYSCEVKNRDIHFCAVYEHAIGPALTEHMNNCAAVDGVSGTACSAGATVGRCESRGQDSYTLWYADSGTSTADDKFACAESGGSWKS